MKVTAKGQDNFRREIDLTVNDTVKDLKNGLNKQEDLKKHHFV
jgi:hypothetical protein